MNEGKLMSSQIKSNKHFSMVISIIFAFLSMRSLAVAESKKKNSNAECSREAAVKMVEKVCGDILKYGTEVKAHWPKDLLFVNCGDNYVWIQDTSPEVNIVFHPVKRRLDGQSVKEYLDGGNLKLFVEFDKAAKKNKEGAWVDYLWEKPGDAKPTPKTSFVKMCKFGDDNAWIAGSGVWISDLKN
jgi:signal transduction histidine kinase